MELPDLSPCRLDLGQFYVMVKDHIPLGEPTEESTRMVAKTLRDLGALSGKGPLRETPQDIVIYGFGRIGRLLARILLRMVRAPR